MRAVFQIGQLERHSVEVEESFSGRQLTIRVDGSTVLRRRWSENIAWENIARPFQGFQVPFSVGQSELHNIELLFNYFTSKYEVYVNGNLFVGCLFPQAIGYNAFLLALFALVLALTR